MSPQRDITFAEFKHIAVLEGRPQYRTYVRKGFSTLSVKAEFVSERLKAWDFDPLPIFNEDPDKRNGNFPLLLASGKNALFRHCGGRYLGSLRKLSDEHLVALHPETFRSYAIEEGDLVTISTLTGRITQKEIFNKEIDSRVVYVDFTCWFPEEGPSSPYGWDEANINIIIENEFPYGKELGAPNL